MNSTKLKLNSRSLVIIYTLKLAKAIKKNNLCLNIIHLNILCYTIHEKKI